MRLSDENLRGKTVIGADGQAVGEVATLFLDSDGWRIESLQAYVLVSPIADRLEAFIRTEAGFIKVTASADEQLELHCLGPNLLPSEIIAHSL